MQRKRNLNQTVLAMAAVVLASCSSAAKEERKVLHFSAIPDQNSTEMEEKFQPLADYLGTALGVPVEYVPARDYQATVEMFKNGDVLLGWFGGLTGVQARRAVPGAHAVARGNIDSEYYSYFIAHRDTGLTKQETFPQAISDLRFTFGSESSTSGRLMPEFFIRCRTGKSPQEFFSHPVAFSGSHDKTAELVESGQYEAGVLNYAVYERRVREGKTDPSVVRVIWKTPAYVDYHWVAHPELENIFGVGFTELLQQELIGIEDPGLLAALSRRRLIPASDSDYRRLVRVAEQLGMVR